MRMLGLCWSLLFIVASGPVVAQDWAGADAATIRLKPSAFKNIPAAVRAELDRRGCTVPQPYGAKRPANVVCGRFASGKQMDWAALCSRERISVILVFRGGSTTDVAELAREPDVNFLQGIGDGIIGYSRSLGVADAQYIRRHYIPGSGPLLPPLDHEGINDIFVGKGSVVRYWSGGRWLQLGGAD
jgi:hypothetical protein